MQPNLAQVLNTLAHEIRTPLAVSQGYLKLYLDGRLTNADDQRRAFQQTRDALGVLATLCTDMTRVGALSEQLSPALVERVSARAFVEHVQGAADVAGSTWTGESGPAAVAAQSVTDLAHAVAVVAKAAFDEARESPRAVHVTAGDTLVLHAGTPEALPALAAGADAPGARAVEFTKGGKGLRLIWAAFVLQRHRVQTWTHGDHRASVAFSIPLVEA
jgi:signal transduction histidine kinase